MAKTTFVDGDASQGILGTIVSAAFLNALNHHRHRGLDVDGDGALNYAVDTGADNAYAIVLTPALDAYIPGMPIMFKANHTNTGAATLAVNDLAGVAIKRRDGTDMLAGDIPAGAIITVAYDGAYYQLLDAVANHDIISIGATVGANALALSLNPCTLDFRSTTLTNGVPNRRIVPAAISIVIPSGATLGTTNAVAARLILLAIDNAGTIELAVVNQYGGNNLDETTLISTTAISDAADSTDVIYSANARNNVPFRVVGFIDITEATAGTWDYGPTLVQGCGGQALTAMSSIGYGQTWQQVTRTFGVTYYNTTGRPIIFVALCGSALTNASMDLFVNGIKVGWCGADDSNNTKWQASAMVPPGQSYVCENNYSSMNITCLELR